MKKRLFLISTVVVCFFSTVGFSQELIKNGGFEDLSRDAVTNSVITENWNFFRGDNFEINTNSAYNGEKSLRFKNNAVGAAFQTLALEKNQTYNVSFKAKWSTNSSGEVKIKIKDDNGTVLEQFIMDSYSSNWETYRFQFTTGNRSAAEILITRWGNPTGYFNFDDISVISTDSYIIINDDIEGPWKDTDGNNVTVGLGSHITKIGDIYYWIGTNEALTDGIHMYSSKSLGSSSWKYEGLMVSGPGQIYLNVTLLENPTTGKFVILAKGVDVYQSDVVTGPYVHVNRITPDDLGAVGANGDRGGFHNTGGMSAFQDANGAGYLVISRRNTQPITAINNLAGRYVGIYKLTPDYLDVEEEIFWGDNIGREAMWIFKKDNLYYMTSSRTDGWSPSPCYYRTSTDLKNWSSEGTIGTSPFSNISFNSQHRFIIEIDGNWMFGGDRYPNKDDDGFYSLNLPYNILTPVVWDGNRPVITYEKTWSTDAYFPSNLSSKTVANVKEAN